MPANPLFCAIDRPDLEGALGLAQALRGHVGGVKLGLELFTAQGPRAVEEIAALGLPVFLDLKLHDIPNTVAAAVRSAGHLGAAYLTVHAAGGGAMLRAAADAARGSGLKLLAITVLTSLDGRDLAATGIGGSAGEQALRLARLARGCGIHGLVSSAQEVAALRAALGPEAVLVTPGIRPEGSQAGDQKRVMTPRQALDAGADLLVIGRPITEAADPAGAAAAILAGLADA